MKRKLAVPALALVAASVLAFVGGVPANADVDPNAERKVATTSDPAEEVQENIDQSSRAYQHANRILDVARFKALPTCGGGERLAVAA